MANAILDGDYERQVEIKAKIERESGEEVDDRHPLFSKVKGRRVSIADKMREMDEEYDDLMFTLSDNSHESIRTVKTFSVEEVVKFTRQLNEKYKRQKDARSDSSDTH